MMVPTTPVDGYEPFDLSLAKQVVMEALNLIEDLDGQVPPNPDRGRGSGETSRELLNLADNLALAASLVRNQYWTWKGGQAYEV